MLVKISCARCKGPLMLNEEHVGRLVRCPKCKNTFTAKSAEPEEEPVTLDVIDATPPPAPSPKRRGEAAEPVEVTELSPVELELEPEPAPRRRPSEPPRGAAAPPRRPVGRRWHGARFRFPVDVLDDSRDELEGRVEAVANGDGLELRDGRRLLLFAPVGTPAEHIGNSEVEVQVNGRRVRLEVIKRGRSQRLAHDLARFLNEERGPLDPDHYRRSRALMLTLIGVPVAVLVVVGAVFLIRSLLPASRIDESAWKEFRPPDSQCRLLMPGTPGTRQEFARALNQPVMVYVVEVKHANSEFGFLHYRIPDRAVGDFPLQKHFDAVRAMEIANPPGAEFVSLREIMLGAHPGREYIVKVGLRTKVISRLYIVDERDLYLLTARGDNYEPNTPDVAKFFNSFRLLRQQPVELPEPPLVATLKADASRGPPSVNFFPNSDRLLVGRDIYTVNGWIRQGALGGNVLPSVVALAPNGQTAAVAGAPGELELVNVASGRTTKLVQHNRGERVEAVAALAFSPDGKLLAGQTASTFILWDVATGTKQASHSNDGARPKSGIPVVAFSPDNAHLVTSAGAEKLILRDPKSGDVQQDLGLDPRTGVTGVAFSLDGKKLAWMDSKGNGRISDLVLLRTSSLPGPGVAGAARVHAVAFALDGRTVAATGPDDRVLFLDVNTRLQRLALRTGQAGGARSLVFSSDRRLLATTGNDGVVKIWDVSSLTGGAVARPPARP